MLGTFFTLLATALSLQVVDIVVPGVELADFSARLGECYWDPRRQQMICNSLEIPF
jgi:hypothetical protein